RSSSANGSSGGPAIEFQGCVLGHNRIEGYIMRCMGQCGYLLHGIGEANQQWAAAVHQLPAECEMPVIEAATHADAIAARVKTDQWHEHHVELARGARRR